MVSLPLGKNSHRCEQWVCPIKQGFKPYLTKGQTFFWGVSINAGRHWKTEQHKVLGLYFIEWWFSHISKAYLHSHMTNTWVEIANQRFGTRLNAVQIFSQDGMQAQDKDQQVIFSKQSWWVWNILEHKERKRCKEVVNHRLFFHIGCRIQSDASRNRAKEWLSFNHQGKVADQRSD